MRLTNDEQVDAPTLWARLQTDCRASGAIGPRDASRYGGERLQAAGVTDEDLARIHRLMGLDLSGVMREGIARSIVATMIAGRYGRERRPRPATLRATDFVAAG